MLGYMYSLYKNENSKDNVFEFLFGIVGFWFCRNTTKTQWGDRVWEEKNVWEIRCQLEHSLSHFGDFCTLWEGVSE